MSAEYRGAIPALLLLATPFLIQARMPLAFLATWARCWLLFSRLSTSTPRSFSAGQLSSHSSPSLEHCVGNERSERCTGKKNQGNASPCALLSAPEGRTGQKLHKKFKKLIISFFPIIFNGGESHFTAPSSPLFWILILLNSMENFYLKVGGKYT